MSLLTLRFEGRPPTINAERYRHWSKASQTVRQYREEAHLRARRSRHVPFTEPVMVEVEPHCKDNRLADAGACFTVAKAIIDGIVDAGLLPDDGPRWVRSITFLAPRNAGEDALYVSIGPRL